MQDNKRSSFRNLNALYDILPIPPEIKKDFRACRDELNGYLDSVDRELKNQEK